MTREGLVIRRNSVERAQDWRNWRHTSLLVVRGCLFAVPLIAATHASVVAVNPSVSTKVQICVWLAPAAVPIMVVCLYAVSASLDWRISMNSNGIRLSSVHANGNIPWRRLRAWRLDHPATGEKCGCLYLRTLLSESWFALDGTRDFEEIAAILRANAPMADLAGAVPSTPRP